ncbi:hypothetical protein RclHR1_10070003 [Rhizophagus clarus]|uniref:Uncharacterized protein n=1 Tax=Rhizophagus clarus TaxID=94130 RepID=A0A2Z6QEZ9_9GLOM|nr:hypothetical protein RclHR1_10070003 [Rhizophagus clarus]
MPVWSLSEIKHCKNNIDIFKNLGDEEILDLYNKWGGIPQYVLFHARNYALQSLLDAGINEVNTNIMSFVGVSTQGNNINHRLVHICTNVPEKEEAEEGNPPNEGEVDLTFSESSTSINLEPLTISSFSSSTSWEHFTSSTPSTLRGPPNKPSVAQNDNEGVPYYSQFILEFASDYVAEGVINRLSEINKQALFDFLLNGGKFRYRSLENVYDDGKFEMPTRPKMEKLLFSNIDEIQECKYCIPTQMNNKSFDAIIYPNFFLQMTTARNHPIIKSGLEDYIKGTSEAIDFFFVVPKSMFLNYKKQSLHTTKRTVLRNKPPWLDRFTQNVLDVDLKLKDI